MITRILRRRWAVAILSNMLLGLVAVDLFAADDAVQPRTKNVAAVVTLYRHNTHADVIVSRLLEGYALDGTGERPSLNLVGLYVDQVEENDLSRPFAKKFGFPIFNSIEGALTLGTGKLAVDGVLLVAEHGNYPLSKTEQTEYPKRRMFAEIVRVFEASGRVVPVFCDKHLSDNWDDAKWIYDTARTMKIPMMAGSSVPSYRREPPVDVVRDRPVKEIVGAFYGPVEAYGFHALEAVQSLAERRKGGETGVVRVQCVTGDAVWKGADDGTYNVKLLEAALSRGVADFDPTSDWRAKIKEPLMFVVDYRDGLRARVFLVNGLMDGFSAAWEYGDDGSIESTKFALQEGRPFTHFAYLLRGIERMMQTGKPTWPVERTLLTTGVLNAAMISKTSQGMPVRTGFVDSNNGVSDLNLEYRSDWNWQQPPAP